MSVIVLPVSLGNVPTVNSDVFVNSRELLMLALERLLRSIVEVVLVAVSSDGVNAVHFQRFVIVNSENMVRGCCQSRQSCL